MSDEAGASGEQGHGNIKSRARFTENPGGEEGAAYRSNNRVHRVPRRIDPRNFIGKKLEDIKRSGDPENERMAEDRERLILRRQHDPVLMNRHPGNKDGEVKIYPRKASQAKGDPEQL